MNEVDARAVDPFGSWLRTLAVDAMKVAEAVASDELSAEARRPLAAGLNYLFKSLDLIDDGIEGLGFLDDAFVLRVSAARSAGVAGLPAPLLGLAADADLILEFLGDLAPRFDRYVSSLAEITVRGRAVAALVEPGTVQDEFISDVRTWASHFQPPQFVMDEHGLVKLRSFLAAKLPV